jgi:hypothetical protein
VLVEAARRERFLEAWPVVGPHAGPPPATLEMGLLLRVSSERRSAAPKLSSSLARFRLRPTHGHRPSTSFS